MRGAAQPYVPPPHRGEDESRYSIRTTDTTWLRYAPLLYSAASCGLPKMNEANRQTPTYETTRPAADRAAGRLSESWQTCRRNTRAAAGLEQGWRGVTGAVQGLRTIKGTTRYDTSVICCVMSLRLGLVRICKLSISTFMFCFGAQALSYPVESPPDILEVISLPLCEIKGIIQPNLQT